MVAENWHSTRRTAARRHRQCGCGSYSSTQQAHVSLIDISDPTGQHQPHTPTSGPTGQLGDQFKMTYVHDAAANTGTFFGIFGRQVWSAANCPGTRTCRTRWSPGTSPSAASRRGWTPSISARPSETVRGSAFDVDRKVAYAITAAQIDPLYALISPTRAT